MENVTDKLDLTSLDIVNENVKKIAELFPNCITETENGKGIDFDLLKQELNHEIIEGNKERYRLEWPGKKEAIVTANLPTTKTLRPVREDSVDFDNTENLYIEGDNLEVLKLLQESYLGKIKIIYIDPPYNTGNDFVYKDNFTQDSEEFKQESGLKDEYNQRLVANPETAGRYHSDWLTMMYPRLKLARNLLTEDGIIFISIDENEVHNLRKICDEIFGEINFLAEIIWEKRFTKSNNAKRFGSVCEYILCFRKNESLDSIKENRTKKSDSIYSNPDNDPRGNWTSVSYVNITTKEQRPNCVYNIKNPFSGIEVEHPTNAWKYEYSTYLKHVEENKLYWGKKGENTFPRLKKFLTEMDGGMVPSNLWSHEDTGTTDKASKELENLIGRSVFDFPKPHTLIKRIISLQLNSKEDKDLIVLDFFSGSGTTAHAVMELNKEDNGSRKFIMVQVPVSTDEKSEAFRTGFKNICEIGKARIKNAGKQIKEAQFQIKMQKESELALEESTGKLIDTGFRVFKLAESNMKDVYYRPQDYKQEQLDAFADNIKPDRTADDLLAQIMLDWGLPLSLKIEQLNIGKKQVFKVAENSLLACFDNGLNEAFAKEIAKLKPLRVVFKDSSFEDNSAKENVKQLLKQLSPETEMKVI